MWNIAVARTFYLLKLNCTESIKEIVASKMLQSRGRLNVDSSSRPHDKFPLDNRLEIQSNWLLNDTTTRRWSILFQTVAVYLNEVSGTPACRETTQM
jgi:hypothetical protein